MEVLVQNPEASACVVRSASHHCAVSLPSQLQDISIMLSGIHHLACASWLQVTLYAPPTGHLTPVPSFCLIQTPRHRLQRCSSFVLIQIFPQLWMSVLSGFC